MVSWCLIVSVLAAASAAEAATNATKKTRGLRDEDTAGSGSEFFPQYGGFQPFAHPQGLHDLTAVQQTHALGSFQQHRFQPQQHFAHHNNFQNQPLLFSQQTDFGDQQRHPPQNIVPPPQGQPPPAHFPSNSQFRPQPPPPPPPPQKAFHNPKIDARPSFNDHRQVKFPASEQFTLSEAVATNPSLTSGPRYRQPPAHNPPPPPPPESPVNNQFQHSNFQTPSAPFFDNNRNQFFGQQQFDQPIHHQPTASSGSFSNQGNQQFNQNQQQNLQPNNFHLDQRNQPVPQVPPPAFDGSHFNQQGGFNQGRLPASTFRNGPPPPPPPVLTQQSISYNQPPETTVTDFQRANAQQPKPLIYQDQQNYKTQKPNNQHQNYQQQDYQIPFTSGANNYQPNNEQVSFNPNRKPAFLPTPVPTTDFTSADSRPKRPLLSLSPAQINQYTEQQEHREVSQRPKENKYTQKTRYEYQPTPDSREEEYRPTTPTPIVKEITINLATTPKPDKSSKKGKHPVKEKTQEDYINEQIHKLLQGHNLELANSQESNNGGSSLPVPELPAHLKDKYQIKLVNSDVLSEISGKKKKKVTTTETPFTLPPPPELPEHLKKQYEVKLVSKEELLRLQAGNLLTNSDLVEGASGNVGNQSSVFLANGQQLQILNLPKSASIPDSVAKGSSIKTVSTTTTTTKPPKALFDELANGVLPPGANVELINAKGETERVNDLKSKKVTFVLLEEQPDGSVKVQGVKGNGEHERTEKDTVESLLKKIKEGTLKLPPSEKSSLQTNEIPNASPTPYDNTYATVSASPRPVYTTERPHRITLRPTIRPYSMDTVITTAGPDITTPFLPTPTFTVTKRPKSKTRPNQSSSVESYETSTFSSKRYKSTRKPQRRKPTTTSTTTPVYEYDEDEDYNQRSSNFNGEGPIPTDVIGEESNIRTSPSLISILQEYGLFEMAKFLDQSGLDTILNETGPYTIFIPTDAAFAVLQEQLGGTDKAEDKFRENPRLLSGLLLHHVVPGSFKISDLQDEMTGVSLAGTQLRVNSYSAEKKDPIVTINGAVVSASKKDIPVPQGLAHAVDRVLFPLPVGDLVQTLKGDRERRFTKFVKSIEASGLEDLLTGSKTYTVFAPTDAAFTALTDSELDKLLTRREAARTIVLRHIMPGTLYSAGMHFYQIKDSMERGQRITIQKELGKVKANSVQVKTANIPATNGVVHVVDSLL